MPKDLTKQKLVVVGNGMAGMRFVENLLDRDREGYDITVFGAEPHGNYNRIMLSPVLAGEKTIDEIILNPVDWYAENDITLHCGDAVASIDRDAKKVISESGEEVAYDKLLLATGSDAIRLPLPGADLEGVITFRDLADVDAMLKASETERYAVVIGGGLLGLEAANGLRAKGMNVTVIHLMDRLMERQLDSAAGYLLKRELERRGITVLLEANTDSIQGKDGEVNSVLLKDGRELPADLVVMAVGIRPNVELGQAAGLDVERGILIDDHMQTSDPDIFALGECVQHRGMCYGLVAPLFDMAGALAKYLDGEKEAAYEGSVLSTKLKVTGVDLFSAGNFQGGPGTEDLVFRDAARGVYKRIVLKDGKIEGVVLYGDAVDGAWYFQMMKDATDVSDMRETIAFGPRFSAPGESQAASAVALLPNDAEICGCNGVSKGTIVQAITEKGLTDLDGVKAHTKASASCGSCAGLCEQLLADALGGDYEVQTVKPACGCTDLGHDDIRKLFVAKELKSIPEVMQELEWKTPDGCSSCRPALNYYLLCAWPGEYVDHAQSRFINERAHANIQKDGTYSVVPRMWGGLTSSKELRAIADVVDKFDIPTVKVTGGQRIDLLGVQKEDLPAVWADLNAAGMVSGHAYGKSLRTVKTCVGSDWCRFGTQDSTGLGVKLEQMTWGSWTPHKFKMAVSGCPRNCAEATIKDFGVVCVDSGYELHVGGNGGIHVRATEFLCKVDTEDEAMEYAGAFMQLYREEGRYLERTAPYLERVGLDHVKARIVEDDKGRRELFGRFLFSQSFSQTDPWAERAAGKDKSEFTPLAIVA
ncbi:MAG: nitrite reductase large subunit NirB [Magnetovibrionaceae bacterium]